MSTLVDHEKTASDLNEQELGDIITEAGDAWTIAKREREDLDDQAVKNWKLYRAAVDEVASSRRERGGWSKIEVPLIYWLAETMLPRLGVSPPQLTVVPKVAEAAPFAYSKQLRMNHYISESDWESVLIMIAKSQLVLGDGFGKVYWDAARKMPHLMWVNWHDFFVSIDARDFHSAEWIFHRTYWTKRQLEARNDPPDGSDSLYINLDKVIEAGPYGPDQDDHTYQERRETGNWATSSDQEGLYALVEGWHADGSYIVFSPEIETINRAEKSPFHDRQARLIRPFAHFGSTPDLNSPYSIPVTEILEDHQIELSTIRNQWIDQMTANINAGVVHDSSIPDEEVEEFQSAPNGRLATDLPDVRGAIMRLPPGQVTGDFPLLYSMLRSESQMTSGVSDISAGQSSVEGLENQTATGMSIISQEANRRMQLMIKFSEIAIGNVAKLFDAMDRQFGGMMFVPTEAHFVPDQAMMGFGQSSPGFAALLTTANASRFDYLITVDAGSSRSPEQYEETQRLITAIGALQSEPIAPFVNWYEMARKVILSFGMNPDQILVSEQELQQRAQAEQEQLQAEQTSENEAAVEAELQEVA